MNNLSLIFNLIEQQKKNYQNDFGIKRIFESFTQNNKQVRI